MMRIELYSRTEGDAVMKMNSSRRDFLSAGVAVPVAGLWSLADMRQPEAQASAAVLALKLQYRLLGNTGLKVTTVGFGCMITSDPTVIERAADLGVGYFDTARGYQGATTSAW